MLNGMQTKYRIATEQIAIALVFMISLVVSDYVLKTVLHIPAQDALFTIIVTAILALPPYVLGNFVGFRKYYIKQIHGLGLSKLEYKAGSNLALIGALISAVAGFLYFTYFSIVHGSFVFAILHLCPAVALIWLIVRLGRKITGYLRSGSESGLDNTEVSDRSIFLLTVRLEVLAMLTAASILSGFYLLITVGNVSVVITLLVLGAILGFLVFKVAQKGVREFSIECPMRRVSRSAVAVVPRNTEFLFHFIVTPAKAGVQEYNHGRWIPACAGMTNRSEIR